MSVIVPVKFLTWIVLPPLALVTVFFAVANRHRVLFSFDPFDPDRPALALEVPMFVIVLAAVFIGILIGGISAWARQGRRRKTARTRRDRALEVARIEKPLAPLDDQAPVALTARPPAAD